MPERIYLDSNATTPVIPAVWEAMRPYLVELAGNPSSVHQEGRRARRALEEAREKVASLLNAHPDEVLFTSGATEANNLALFGLAGDAPGHLVASPIEHPCVTEPLRQLQTRGFTLDWLAVNRAGVVEGVGDTVQPPTRLLAVMLVNHETGAVQPVAELAAQRPAGVMFHCDAAQAVGKVPVDFRALGVDTLSLSGHKFHGPKGVGVLLLRRGTRLRPALYGGHQQRGLRPGTEPLFLAVGLAAALEIAVTERDRRRQHVQELRRTFFEVLTAQAGPIVQNGPMEEGVPHTLNVSFPGLRGDVLLMSLDLAGVACSTGAACSSGSLLPSPVLRAMGLPDELLRSAMRFSFSALNTVAEVTEAARRVVEVVARLRSSAECP